MTLWKYNTATGYWDRVRDCQEKTANAWLETFRRDEPAAHFTLATRRPKNNPTRND